MINRITVLNAWRHWNMLRAMKHWSEEKHPFACTSIVSWFTLSRSLTAWRRCHERLDRLVRNIEIETNNKQFTYESTFDAYRFTNVTFKIFGNNLPFKCYTTVCLEFICDSAYFSLRTLDFCWLVYHCSKDNRRFTSSFSINL